MQTKKRSEGTSKMAAVYKPGGEVSLEPDPAGHPDHKKTNPVYGLLQQPMQTKTSSFLPVGLGRLNGLRMKCSQRCWYIATYNHPLLLSFAMGHGMVLGDQNEGEVCVFISSPCFSLPFPGNFIHWYNHSSLQPTSAKGSFRSRPKSSIHSFDRHFQRPQELTRSGPCSQGA